MKAKSGGKLFDFPFLPEYHKPILTLTLFELDSLMKNTRWFYHPIFIFVLSIIALGTSLFLYIYWYMKVSSRVDSLVRNLNIEPDQVFRAETWVVILVLSVLVALILVGIFTIFVYHQKTLQLYRLQNNFINNFTHELKTPVTSLKLYLETFMKHEISREDQIRYLGYMLQDVSRLSDNISRILNLARIETKTYSGEFVRIQAAGFIERFFRDNRHLFPESQITVHPPETGDFACYINIPLFEMVLINIVTNAIKYNKSEKPTVDIRFEDQTRRHVIHFRDNGMGLEKKEISKVFRKFYQVGIADVMTARGSGLGLYMVQQIVRVHKGKVTAKSEGPDQGSVFSVTLPKTA